MELLSLITRACEGRLSGALERLGHQQQPRYRCDSRRGTELVEHSQPRWSGAGSPRASRVRDQLQRIVVVQRARHDRNGNMSIIQQHHRERQQQLPPQQRSAYNNGNNTCTYSQSTNSVGDIIFRSRRAWPPVRTYTIATMGVVPGRPGCEQQLDLRASYHDRNGNLVIQRRASQPQRCPSRSSAHARTTAPATNSGRRRKQQEKDWKKAQRAARDESRRNLVADTKPRVIL